MKIVIEELRKSTPATMKSNELESKSQLRAGTVIDAELNMIMESFASENAKTTSRGRG